MFVSLASGNAGKNSCVQFSDSNDKELEYNWASLERNVSDIGKIRVQIHAAVVSWNMNLS